MDLPNNSSVLSLISSLYSRVLKYAPELDKRIRPHLKLTNDAWRVDETYIEIKGEWNICIGL